MTITLQTIGDQIAHDFHVNKCHLSPAERRFLANLIDGRMQLMVTALKTARLTIKALHGIEAWSIYEKHSPEMKLIDAAIAVAGIG